MDLPKTTAFVSGANRGLEKHLADQLTSRGAGVQYGDARAYLTAARAAAAEADGLNRYLITAFPAMGGTAMQRRQNYFLYPGNR